MTAWPDHIAAIIAAMPDGLRVRLPTSGQRPRRRELRALVRDLCAWRNLGAQELADLLGRHDAKALVRRHLTPMIEAGVLAYAYPQMPNHPAQRYVAPPPAEPRNA